MKGMAHRKALGGSCFAVFHVTRSSEFGKRKLNTLYLLKMCKSSEKSHGSQGNCNDVIDPINLEVDKDADIFYGRPIKINFSLSVLATLATSIIVFFAYLRKYLSSVYSKFFGEVEPLFNSFEHTYRNYYFPRVCDCFANPITSMATSVTTVMEQVMPRSSLFSIEFGKLKLTGRTRDMINLGSYNYLGMNQNTGPIAGAVKNCIKKLGVGLCSPRNELGTTELHCKLEKSFASFLGVEDCITFGMGFATNSLNIPALIGSNCLVLSDVKNHASILIGCKNATTSIKQVFKHNDMDDLEKKLKEAIVRGNVKINRPYKKIIVIVEGIYSMEGTICKLRKLIELKNKYRFYLYVDEAHSIGAIGKSGRGVCQLFDVDPKSVDILMGTFTKSFAAAGGYIAGSKDLINHIRIHSPGTIYATSMSPVIVQQIISSLNHLMDPIEGAKKFNKLAWNTRYFRSKLQERKLIVCGSPVSPVIPVVIVNPSVASYVHRIFMANGIAIVVAGFPAVELTSERIRFCLSSEHTKEMLDHTLQVLFKLVDQGIIPTLSD